MTVAAKPTDKTYAGDGASTAFAAPFRFTNPWDVAVTRTNPDGSRTELAYGSGYTVSGGSSDAGGTVTLASAAAAGTTINVRRETSRAQQTDYADGDTFPAESHEQALDRLTLVTQEHDREIGRAPRFPRGAPTIDFADLTEMIDGGLLVKAAGALRPLASGPFAGKYYGGAAITGEPVPISGGGADDLLREDLATNGAPLVAFVPWQGVIGRSLQRKLEDEIALPDARQANDSDDKNALAELVNDGWKRVRAPGQRGFGDNGDYLIGCSPWTNPEAGYTDPELFTENAGNLGDIHLIGDGKGKTVFDQGEENYCLMVNSLSDDEADNRRGVHISHLTVRGRADLGASEPQHLIALFGFSGATIEHVAFENGRADGLYCSMGPKQSSRRHNSNLRVAYCDFDGDVGDALGAPVGRNAITVEDCIGTLIAFNRFRRWTSGTANGGSPHPGFIDFEPQANTDQYRIRLIRVLYNWFFDNPSAAVCFFLSHLSYYATEGGDAQAIGNVIERCLHGFDMVGYGPDNGDYPDRTWRHDIVLRDNRINDTVLFPIRSRGIYGCDVIGNKIRKAGGGLSLANVPPGLTVGADEQDWRVRENVLQEIAQSSTYGGPAVVSDGTLRNVAIEANDLIECGRTDNAGGWGFLARTGGDVDLRLNGNRVWNTTGRMKKLAEIQTGLPTPITINAAAQKVGNVVVAGTDPSSGDNFTPPAGTDFTAGIVYANGWSAYDSNHVSLVKKDGVVSLLMSLKGGATPATTLMLTLPPGCWPRKDVTLQCNGNGSYALCELNVAGQLAVKSGVSATETSFPPIEYIAA
jgi:hypothetical protein